MTLCKWCKLESVGKAESHVIPRWLYRDGHGNDVEDRRVVKIEVNEERINPNYQDIKKTKFLCDSCELLTSKFDRKASQVLKRENVVKGKVKVSKIDGVRNFICLEDINGADIWKFVVSVILREFYFPKATHWGESNLTLNKYEKIFTDSLRSDVDPPFEKIPIFCFGSNGQAIDSFVTLYPHETRFGPAKAIIFQTGHFHFLLFPNTNVQMPFPLDYRLNKRQLPVILVNPMDDGFFPRALREMLEKRKQS